MVNEKRELTVKNGATVVATAYEYYKEAGKAWDVLESLTGWDDYSAMEISTAPALHKPGSYLLSTHAGEREVVAKIQRTSETDVKILLNSFQSLMLTGTSLTLERVYKNSSCVEKRKEVLNGLISGLSWDRQQVNASLTITFKCLNPVKTVYIDGSGTPVSGGSL